MGDISIPLRQDVEILPFLLGFQKEFVSLHF